MSDRIVFLDIDGVLNCWSTKERIQNMIGIDEGRVEILRRIVTENEADIVLVSSWKEDWARWEDRPSPEQSAFGDYLDERLALHGLKIRDKTEDDWWNRGQGIVRWILGHECSRFVVLDDERFEDYKGCGVSRHQVQTSFQTGLKEAHIRQAAKLFRRPIRIPAGWDEIQPTRWRSAHFGR